MTSVKEALLSYRSVVNKRKLLIKNPQRTSFSCKGGYVKRSFRTKHPLCAHGTYIEKKYNDISDTVSKVYLINVTTFLAKTSFSAAIC